MQGHHYYQQQGSNGQYVFYHDVILCGLIFVSEYYVSNHHNHKNSQNYFHMVDFS